MFGDATGSERKVSVEESLSVDEWLKLRRDAALKIDPTTAEVFFSYEYVIDPYGIHADLSDEEKVVGRVYYARSPESDIWVCFDDLPKEVRDELYTKLASAPDPLTNFFD